MSKKGGIGLGSFGDFLKTFDPNGEFRKGSSRSAEAVDADEVLAVVVSGFPALTAEEERKVIERPFKERIAA